MKKMKKEITEISKLISVKLNDVTKSVDIEDWYLDNNGKWTGVSRVETILCDKWFAAGCEKTFLRIIWREKLQKENLHPNYRGYALRKEDVEFIRAIKLFNQ